MKKGESFLTQRQLKILKLRGEERTQKEIARLLGTSRVCISITEKRARENIEKARRTIEAYEMLAPVVVKIKKGEDLFDIPAKIFREADRHGIKVVYNSTSLAGMLRRRAGDKIAGNRVSEEFEVRILRSGKI